MSTLCDRGVEHARGHLLVALVEQLAHLDEPGADTATLFQHGYDLRFHAARPPACGLRLAVTRDSFGALKP